MDLSKYDGKHVRVRDKWGEIFTGMTEYGNYDFLECEYGGERCLGIAANMDFLLVCTYEENGENPELVFYKKR